ncbi:MAG: GAF domain-containing SpoIIE family protein phosphatase, partial [Actinomycetota bacterium]
SEVAHALLGLSGALAEVRSLEDTLQLAVGMVRELLGAERCFSASWIAGRERFEITGHVGFDDPESEERLYTLAHRPGGLPLLRASLKSRAPMLIGDTVGDGVFSVDEAETRRAYAYVGLPLIRWGEEFGVIGLTYPEPRRFTSKEESLARGIARTVGVALANARQFNLLQTLRFFGERVGAKLSLQRVITEVARGARELLHGDGAWIYFLDPSSRSLVVTGHDPLPVEGLAHIDITTEIWSPLAQGKAIPITHVEEVVPHPTGPMSAVIAPIPGTTSLLGAVLVLFDRNLTLGADDVEALSVLAGQSAMALENAQRFERQQSVARRLQEGLLATDMPTLPDYSFGAVYEPAGGDEEIGGDFYDVFDLPDGRIAIAVGDVSGKGAEAAAQTAMAKYMLRAFATRNSAPSSALFHLNNSLYKSFGEDKFLSLTYGVLDPVTNRMVIGRGGHPAPLVYRYATGTVDAIEPPGSLLGCFEDENYDQATVDLSSGDVFVAYTDGIVEAREGPRLYGRWRLEKALAHYASSFGVDALARRLWEDAKDFGTIGDDTIVLTLGCRVAPK